MFCLYKQEWPINITWEDLEKIIPEQYLAEKEVPNIAEVIKYQDGTFESFISRQIKEEIEGDVLPALKSSGSCSVVFESDGDDEKAFEKSGFWDYGDVYVGFIGTYMKNMYDLISKLPATWHTFEGVKELLDHKLSSDSTVIMKKRIRVLGKQFTKFGGLYYREVKTNNNTSWTNNYIWCDTHRKRLDKGEKYFLHEGAKICEKCFTIIQKLVPTFLEV